MAIALDPMIALIRFGFGARGGGSDLARAATDPRGFLKAELLQPAIAKIESTTLPPTNVALQAVYAEQEQKARWAAGAPSSAAAKPYSPDMMRTVGRADAMATA